MHVSARSDYAVRAVLEIARHQEKRAITSEDIAGAQDIPRSFLLAILADLRRAGLVTSRRGQCGGWRLQRAADSITVADIIRGVDGPLASVQGLRPEALSYSEAAAVLQTVWVALRSSLRDVLELVTVAHLVDGRLPSSVTERSESADAWVPH